MMFRQALPVFFALLSANAFADVIIESKPARFFVSPIVELSNQQHLTYRHKDHETEITGQLQPEKARQFNQLHANLTREEFFPFQLLPVHVKYLSESLALSQADRINIILYNVLQGDEMKVLLHKMML